jgi:hypothetical protein
MKPYPLFTGENILLFEKILFLSIAILAILVLLADGKVNIKIPSRDVEKIKQGLAILPDFSRNLMMDGAEIPDLFTLGTTCFPMNKLIRL